MFVQTQVQEIVCPWSLQGEEEFALRKPQSKGLYAGTLLLAFISLWSKAACALFQGESLSLWEPSSFLLSLFFPKTLFSALCHEASHLCQRWGIWLHGNWKKLEAVP